MPGNGLSVFRAAAMSNPHKGIRSQVRLLSVKSHIRLIGQATNHMQI